jgi:hypothetical protein
MRHMGATEDDASRRPARPAGSRLRFEASSKARSAVGVVTRLAARPVPLLAGLVLVHWLAVAVFALTVRHNGAVYYQGGDQIGYTTSAWLMAHGQLPPTFVGYGWVLPLEPVAWIAHSDYVSFLPWTMLLNVGVLAPIALACVYGLATRIGGRMLGLWAAGMWVAAPFLAIPFFREDYHDRFVEQFLPQALGLTALADYPSMVCLLAAAYLLVRALDAPDWTWAAAAGAAAGVAATVKPANLLFLAGPLLLLLLTRRFRLVLPYAAGLAPPLALLLAWKLRGLGGLPVFAAPEIHIAATTTLSSLGVDVGRYIDYDLDVFRSNMANLREYFWSVRVLQWIPLAGALAVARRSVPLAGLLVGWFAAFLALKGTVTQSTVESGSFFRLLMPAFPAYFLLFASIPLLVPGVAGRISAGLLPAPPRPLGRRLLAAAAVLFVVVPAIAILVPTPLGDDDPDALSLNGILTPVDDSIRVSVSVDGDARTVSWTHRDFESTEVFYRVFRTEAGGADLDCIGEAARECRLQMLMLGTTREPRFTDLSPPVDAVYRIGIATNWENNSEGGDVIAVSRPIAATP